MALTADRAAIAAALTPIGLAVLQYEPDTIEPPCFVIGNAAGTYADDFDGDYTRTFPLTLFVSRSDSALAVAFIDPYVDTSGAKSVPAAIRTMRNGTVIGFAQFGGGYEVANVEYAGVTWEVQLL